VVEAEPAPEPADEGDDEEDEGEEALLESLLAVDSLDLAPSEDETDSVLVVPSGLEAAEAPFDPERLSVL
jgi:hypothetical protein